MLCSAAAGPTAEPRVCVTGLTAEQTAEPCVCVAGATAVLLVVSVLICSTSGTVSANVSVSVFDATTELCSLCTNL